MSRQAFKQLLLEIIQASPQGVKAVLGKYGIANEPSPQILVLACVKHGEAFVKDLTTIALTNARHLSTDVFAFTGVDATTGSDAEKAFAEKLARQEKLKSIIYTGIQAIQTGAEYVKNAKSGAFDKPNEESFDVQVKKVSGDTTILGMPKYYFIAGAVLLTLMITFGLVVCLKKRN